MIAWKLETALSYHHEVDGAIHFWTKCKLLYYNDFLPDGVFCDLQSVLSNIAHFVKKVHKRYDFNPEWTALSKYRPFSEKWSMYVMENVMGYIKH